MDFVRQISRQISFPASIPPQTARWTPPNEKRTNENRFAQNFMQNMKAFFEDAKQGSVDFLSDFTIVSRIDGSEHKAHKIILASQSKYFKGSFRNNPSTSSVSLDFEKITLEACLEGIYTGTTPLTYDNVQDTFIAADYLGIEDLVKQAAKFIISNMDDTNCYDILMFGFGQGNDEMTSSAASHIAGGLVDDPDSNSAELYTLPKQIFLKVLGSNGLKLKETQSGIIVTGLIRELKLLGIIEKYIEINQENEVDDFFASCRFDGFDVVAVEKYHLVKQTLLITLHPNISREDKIDAVNRAVKMSYETNEQNAIENAPSHFMHLKGIGSEIVSICEKLSEKMRKELTRICEAENKDLSAATSLYQRKWNFRRSTLKGTYARPSPESFDRDSMRPNELHIGIIRKISIHHRMWDNRSIIKGLEIQLLGNSETIKIGLDDGPGRTKHEFELEEGEYISQVEGRHGWYLDQITFVTNKSRKFGPIGGDGGDAFDTLESLSRENKTSTCYLEGIEASQVRTQNSFAIVKVRFLMTTIYDSFGTYNNEYERRNIRDLYDASDEDFYMNGGDIMVAADNDESDTASDTEDTEEEEEMEEDDNGLDQEEELEENEYNENGERM